MRLNYKEGALGKSLVQPTQHSTKARRTCKLEEQKRSPLKTPTKDKNKTRRRRRRAPKSFVTTSVDCSVYRCVLDWFERRRRRTTTTTRDGDVTSKWFSVHWLKVGELLVVSVPVQQEKRKEEEKCPLILQTTDDASNKAWERVSHPRDREGDKGILSKILSFLK